ncbi:MAG TPA: polysaccharide biosynthesis C-terminal domain-containing protein [Solirubrobacteraceae bacterium]|nr:polysaccharide biosynthesis C-terminal domain-containing protein [Solirubrobacteraceae bacterium]
MSVEPNVLDTPAAGGKIVRGGALRLIGYAAVIGLSLIPTVLLTRHLGLVRFGEYTTVISLVSVVASVTDIGMSNLGTREFAVREGTERERLMRDLLGLRVILTLLGVLFATLFAIFAGYDPALIAGTVLASLATVALVYQHTLSIPIAAELRLGTLTALDVVRQALTAVAIVALVAAGAGVLPLLAVTVVVYAVLVPATATLARGAISLRMELHPQGWLALLRLTVSFSLAAAVGTIYIYTAQILTSLVASPHQSGMFAISFRVFIVIVTVPGTLVSGALPLLARTARDDRDRLAYAMQRIFEVSLILGVASSLGILAGAPFILAVAGGPEYSGAVDVLRIQGFAMIASFVLAGWGFALLSIKRYRELLAVNAAALAVSCTLTLILAATDGAQGAAFATLGGEFTLALGYLAVLVRSHPELRPRPTILPKLLVATAPAVVVFLLLLHSLPSVALTATVLAVYGLLILITRATPQEITELLPIARRRAGAHASGDDSISHTDVNTSSNEVAPR